MDKMEMTPCVGIERGKICDKKAGPCYKVESYTRDGVKSRWMESVNKYVNEYQCDSIYDIAHEKKYEYEIGDEVYFFMFDDGRGMILGKMQRDL
ncbi:MAG: hypothetical protein IJP78_07860 [Clostridia bacterium]|nr:hypothetical protein [Clostridia bacterium]